MNKSAFSLPSFHQFFMTDKKFYYNKKEKEKQNKKYETINNNDIRFKNNYYNYNTFNENYKMAKNQLSNIYYN